jgi:DHA3 family tetracycline resistance protein-like MFS transporter
MYVLTTFVAGISNRLVFTTSAIYRVQEVGLDPFQLVLVGTFLEITAFTFEIPTGVVADIYSRRLSVIIGMFVIGLGFMIEGLAPLFWVVLLAQFNWGLGWTFISGAHSAWITDEVGVENVGPVFVRGRQLSLFGSLIALPFSVWIANHSLAWPFMIGGGLRVLYGVFLVLFMPETNFKPIPKKERGGWGTMLSTVKQGWAQMRRSWVLRLYMLIGLFVGLYSEGWDRLVDAHLLENFRFPDIGPFQLGAVEWFGLLSFTAILLDLLANEFTKRRLEVAGSIKLTPFLQSLYLVMVACMAVFALSRNFWLAISFMLVFDTLRGVTFPLTEIWLNKHIDSSVRATVLSMTAQLDALGQMAGGPVIGFVGRFRSIRAAILTATLILFPTVPLYGLAKRRDMKKKEG